MAHNSCSASRSSRRNTNCHLSGLSGTVSWYCCSYVKCDQHHPGLLSMRNADEAGYHNSKNRIAARASGLSLCSVRRYRNPRAYEGSGIAPYRRDHRFSKPIFERP